MAPSIIVKKKKKKKSDKQIQKNNKSEYQVKSLQSYASAED